MSTICVPDGIARDQISQAFPHRICRLQAMKCWWWEWPGNEIVPNAHPYTTGSNTSLQQPKTFTWGTYTPGWGKIVPVHVPAPTFMYSSGNVIFSNTQHYAVYMCAIRSSMPSCLLRWLDTYTLGVINGSGMFRGVTRL